jgi:hypothetical protein
MIVDILNKKRYFTCEHENAKRLVTGSGKDVIHCPDCHMVVPYSLAWRWKITIAKLKKIGMI